MYQKIMVVTFTTFIDNNFYKVQYYESESHVRILLGTDFHFIPTSNVHHEFYETEWCFFQSTTMCLALKYPKALACHRGLPCILCVLRT